MARLYLYGCNLHGCNLRQCNLRQCNLRQCNLQLCRVLAQGRAVAAGQPRGRPQPRGHRKRTALWSGQRRLRYRVAHSRWCSGESTSRRGGRRPRRSQPAFQP
ncbi:MAG: pentapeptide repeat-containing protein [Egibacteraceae bacterium]